MNMSTQRWVRFLHDGAVGFGTLAGDAVQVFEGNMFASPRPTGQTVNLASVKLLRPAEPGKVIALYNNFRPWLEKLNVSRPLEPLYFLKPPSAYLDPGEVIRRPASDSRVVFEGATVEELVKGESQRRRRGGRSGTAAPWCGRRSDAR